MKGSLRKFNFSYIGGKFFRVGKRPTYRALQKIVSRKELIWYQMVQTLGSHL